MMDIWILMQIGIEIGHRTRDCNMKRKVTRRRSAGRQRNIDVGRGSNTWSLW